MDAASSTVLLLDSYVGQTQKTSAALVLYGLYVPLFAIAIFTLHRRQTAGKKLLLAASWTLFLVGTAQMLLCSMIAAVSVQLLSTLASSPESMAKVSSLQHSLTVLNAASQTIFVINVFLTDLLFLCRCYLIYARQWKVILFPASLIFLTSVSAVISLATTSSSTPLGWQKVQLVTAVVGYGMGLFANIVLMVLTAGRIWWMSRASVHAHLLTTIKNRYTTTISIILESGAIYCFCAGMLAVSAMSNSTGTFYLVIEGIAFQAVNIAPTLTVVRVGLGHNVLDSVDRGMSPCPAKPGGHNAKVMEC
ncbi:hypothetical protein MSAN_00843300 [Mycena sanguinolenta]|uniref:Uncharacterized protein n=1 Tax=Mycena sanguinolenta TaxID=230812 RepID=A0A8H6Z0T8_9AGAR|nr:hypothetical protein MSAN_00843300 [Mycena sanguinolenta]